MQKKLPIPDNLPNHLTDIFYHININLPKGDLKETVKLDKVINQVNASDVYALQDYPLHNLSEYAGWALNSETTQSASKDSPLLITHWYYWGQQLYRSINPYKLDLKTPSLLEIPAYTKLPESLDSVIAEQDERLDLSDTEAKKINGSIPAMHGVIPKGSIFKQGDVILKKDEKLTTEKLIVLRRAGIKELSIYKNPKILIISMHSFDKEEMSEESLYVKDVLKTWGYEQVEIKSLKPERFNAAFNNLKKDNDPALDDSLTTSRDDYIKFFEEQTSNFDVILCCTYQNNRSSLFQLEKLPIFDQSSMSSALNTRCMPANEIKILKGQDRTPPSRETVQIYDESGNHKGMRVVVTEDKATIINLPGDIQDIAILMHAFVKYILNKHISDFFDHAYFKGKTDIEIVPDVTNRKLLWGCYKAQENGEYVLEIIEQQQSYQIEPFVKANCIVIVPFQEQTIAKGTDLYFMKIG
ncbi:MULTISPECIES: molybdenum cofactor biosysnthesis protein MoeA [Acinetobacter]|jgi:molybdopterin biosynthesis enzyme|uniref:Molybdopterin molybdenumtransferase n=1 Tax=Acinetobacter pittii TaxID=48296 RepID=A0A242U2X6_ACIPI|nr:MULTISPECIES: molybdenum cofactor biosysnthesis protein MoeA [Acinetobacter]EXS25611.1 molybdopterin biosynthesis protein [Acinetobacter baumannii 573719]MBJ8470397.1 molybdenum cofactor biosysnthesis protein MoeA [Acinetobacter pittii]MBJ8500337.1 molybdenum cofactor biosysnthesis protein MoeA [Acinetobacter pittii]MBJ9891079.1 molybdenum cofactor biosysnthesis protein MoeA [Acinetobacter pittii]MCU4477621.1 molybdenum cofactor biosysnthesis protein MoeA [Acinetobacter sp. WU_MDCI_Abxd143]